MLPLRRPTKPITARSVVVLPAPLRPSRVTTSPGATSRPTPCRMWLSPYHASRPDTSSSALPEGVAGAACPFGAPTSRSAMRRSSFGLAAEIGGHDLRIAGHAGVVAFGEHPAARQHRYGVAKAGHHLQVVLHQQHGAAGRHALHERHGAVHVLVSHPGGVAPVVADAAARRLQEFRQEVEAGGLARAVRTDQPVDAAAAYLEGDVAHRDEAQELL